MTRSAEVGSAVGNQDGNCSKQTWGAKLWVIRVVDSEEVKLSRGRTGGAANRLRTERAIGIDKSEDEIV